MSDPSGVSGQEPVPVISVTPDQFKIDVVLDKEVFLDLTLHNTSATLATFKVKTTARDRYLLRPTQDFIRAGETKVCKIVMTKMKEYPDLSQPKNLKDKFLVQSTNIDREVPDLTKFWKELEATHNPKANNYMYAETKIKCKLQVPAKLRAQDAQKRGLAEEEAAAAASKASAAPASAAPSAATLNVDASHEDESRPARHSRTSSTDLAFAASESVVPHAVAPAAVISNIDDSQQRGAAAAASSSDSSELVQELSAAKQKYDELFQFSVRTTKQLEAERLQKESAENREATANERAKAAESKSKKAEHALIATQEEVARLQAALAQAKALSSASSSAEGEEGNSEGSSLTRRIQKANAESTPVKKDATPSASSTPLSSSTPTSSTGSSLATEKAGPSLQLQVWQVALMALVCFVLGRIFG